MDTVILATKLQIPSVRPGIVMRERLLSKLSGGLTRKLTVVSASPGSGKTTLVSEWVNRFDIPAAWVSLDETDNDIARFLNYVVTALVKVAPELKEPIDLLRQPFQSSLIEITATHIINTLVAVPHDLVLVLDDYHLIDQRPIHQVLAYLIEHLPPQVHIYLITRADPPLPLARLRARNQLVEIRVADLCFTFEEAATFLKQAMGLNLSDNEIAELERRTEGWITGLQLAGLSLKDQQDPRPFIATFTGSHEYIADYLVDEVLGRQPEPIKEFLLQTSILERLNGSLCTAVTGQDDGQQTLEYLHTANLFVSTLDVHRQWYTYHKLFSDLLRQRLTTQQGDLIPELHTRAADWYRDNGFPEDAIQHYFEAGNLEQAADQIACAAESMLMRSQGRSLLKWVEQLPDVYIRARPNLYVHYTWALLLSTYSLNAVRSHLQQLNELAPVHSLPLNAFIALFQGHLKHAHTLASDALSHLSEEDKFFYGMATWVANMSEIAESDLQDGSQLAGDVVQSEQTTDNLLVMVITLCHMAELHMRQGRLYEAQAIYERALTLATTETDPLPIAGMAMIGLSGLLREWNDLPSAERYVQEGITLLKNWSETATIDGYITLAFIRVSQGDLEEAQSTLERGYQLALDSDAFDLDDRFVSLMQARFCILVGQIDEAVRWLKESGSGYPVDMVEFESDLSYFDYHLRHHQYLTLIRLWMVQHRYAEALALLKQLEAALERFGWRPSRREIEVQILKALTLQASGRTDQALIWIEKALGAAKPGGYIRSFVDEGAAMAQLLGRAAEQGIHADYIRSILAAFPASEQSAVLVDALTEREMEVLQLIAEGLTNPQIADHLVVAIGTVKAHTSSIYTKLGIGNRVQAVARARELGLL